MSTTAATTSTTPALIDEAPQLTVTLDPQRLRRTGGLVRIAAAATVLASSLFASLLLTAAASGGTSSGSAGRWLLESKADPAVVAALGSNRQARFWVLLRDKADLRKAGTVKGRAAKGQYVFDELRRVADHSQGGLRGLLRSRKVSFTPYWIANAIEVTGDRGLARDIAGRPEVERILAPSVYHLAQATPDSNAATTDSVEWGIANIHADQVWSQLGVRGAGIVVANIDTGVKFDHPALVHAYRGNLGGGVFDHNYNWFDPSHICGNPSLAPCDNNDHGTHTMGTMVGDDGGSNKIGVAPGAKFIAAKGCVSSFCLDDDLLASAQWILAPTDLNGNNPRPDLRPNIVNNSWGGSWGGDPWYQASVDAWVAAGIMPIFANGNNGPVCGTAGAPGAYPSAYSVGAYDIHNAIASFSSRGSSAFGGVKPDIAAPGVNVRSSIATGGYAKISGTSMAAPHVAGTVALMWSARPALVGNLTATRRLLDDSAIDTPASQCGGTDDDNNVFGEGRLDAFAAVSAALSPPVPPVAADDTYTTDEDTPLAVPAPGLLANDTDPAGDPLTAAVVSSPSHGTLRLAANGSFTYTPAQNFNGSDSLTYQASDGMSSSNLATVVITVNPVDDAPTVQVAAGGNCQPDDRTGTVNLLVGDIDTPAADLTLSGTSSNQTLVPNAGIVFTGTGADRSATISANPATIGSAQITIVVSDDTASGTITISITTAGNGNDTVTGTAGTDILLGQNGDDTLNGAAANDLLCGGRGNDNLTGRTGADHFSGGQGIDTATDLTPAQGDTQDATIP